jgi:putative MATE family efflux protein
MAKRTEEEFHKLSITGNMFPLVCSTGFPLAIFALFSGLFTILDTLMASHVSAIAVSAVAYIGQLQQILNAIGGGLVSGSMVLINRSYGAGEQELAAKRTNGLLAMLSLLSLLLLCAIPFSKPILRLLRTPEEFITTGSGYFSVTMVVVILNFYTTLYLNIEKTRGNTMRIMLLNIGTMSIKLLCSFYFIYRRGSSIVMVAVSTAIAYGCLTIVGIAEMRKGESIFSFKRQYFRLETSIVRPLVLLSYPLAIEKASFAMGKTVVNSMVASYGTTTVGALGISNNLSGLVTNLQNGYGDSSGAIISQNQGAKRWDRVKHAYGDTLIMMVLTSMFGILTISLFSKDLIHIFATSRSGNDQEFEKTIQTIFTYDLLSVLPLALNGANMALLLGLGETKLQLIISACRIFVFRIPVLAVIQGMTDWGAKGVGIMMLLSNGMTALLSTAIVICLIRKRNKLSRQSSPDGRTC